MAVSYTHLDVYKRQVLTIDAELQQLAYEQLKGEAGAIVLMDVQTGEILAMVSSPSYDPNKFVDGISGTDYKAYILSLIHI